MIPPPLVISRALLERDLDGILAVDAVTFTNPWTRQMYEWEARRSDVSRLFVVHLAGDAGPLIAYCAVWVIFDELHINNLAVHPDWRRKGIARALLDFVLAEAQAAGAIHATLEVRRSNQPARELYERLGFAVEGVRPQYYSEPAEDALVLWRRASDRLSAPESSSAAGVDPSA
jgi:ribosomal-protein-alanine N-acetyltransferase